MNVRSSPLQFVVRSSVASCTATGTPSSVSLASTSSTNPWRAAFRYAARLSSANRALPFTTVPPRWAWISGAAEPRRGGERGPERAEGRPAGGEHGGQPRSGRILCQRAIQSALDHLWLHFTEMGSYSDGHEVQVIVRGDGCYLEDSPGKRYLDALAGLFCVNIGYGFGDEMGEAAAAQMRELPFAINWTFAHPRSIELADELAGLAPGDLNRVFFVSGGSEAVEAAWKLARQYHAARGERRWKAIARRVSYHGTTMGALSINGCTELRTPFEPLVPDVLHVSNTNRYHRPQDETEEQFTPSCSTSWRRRSSTPGPSTVAMVIVEPVQNAGGSFMPPAGYLEGVRELCDRHGILLCFDEVITGFGRVGHWFAAERFGVTPDLLTSAKGLSSAYAAIGALVASDRVMEPFLADGAMYTHGMTFGGHPVQAAVALKNIEIMRRERIVEHVRDSQADFRARSSSCSSCRSRATCAVPASSTRSSS